MLYIFYGADSFTRLETLAELKQRLGADGTLDTNTVLLAARQTSPQEVIAACSAVPFLGQNRLVIVEGLLQLTQGGGGRRSGRQLSEPGNGTGSWQALVRYVDQMPPSTMLVLLDGEIAPKTPLLEALEAKGTAREFKPKGPKELPEWVRKRAQMVGLRIDGRAASLLAGLAGGQKREREYNDLWSLANELDKLRAYAGNEVVREADVQALTPVLREQKGYLLADAIVEGRPAAAAQLLRELQEQGDPPGVTLATIQTRYRRLCITQDLLDRGASGAAIGQAVGASGYALEKLIEQAMRQPMASLRAAYRRLVQADLDVKRGVYDEALSLELLVQDLASAPARRRPAASPLAAGPGG